MTTPALAKNLWLQMAVLAVVGVALILLVAIYIWWRRWLRRCTVKAPCRTINPLLGQRVFYPTRCRLALEAPDRAKI